MFDQEEESVQRDESKVPDKPLPPPKPASTVVTRYVSGKNPGEFSTILETLPVSASRRRREAEAIIDVRPTASLSLSDLDSLNRKIDNAIPDADLIRDFSKGGDRGTIIELEDSYSYSDPFGGGILISSSYGQNGATDSLESALTSSLFS